MLKAIHNTVPGRRNPEFAHVLPQMGLMHLSIAMLNAAKYISYDAVLDGLILFAGLAPGAQAHFRDNKCYKTNLNFICQAFTSMILRIVEELIEEGDFMGAGVDLLLHRDGPTRKVADVVARFFELFNEDSSDYPKWFKVGVNDRFSSSSRSLWGHDFTVNSAQK